MDKETKKYFDGKFGSMKTRFEQVDNKLIEHGHKFESIDKRFSSLDAKIEKLGEKTESSIEKLAQSIAETIALPLQKHIEETRDYPTVRRDVSILKHDVSKIKRILKIKV